VGIDRHYLSVLIALDAALIMMILAGLAKKRLEWKRPAAQPVARQRDDSSRPSFGPLPGWMRDFLAAGTGIGGAVAIGAGLAGAAVPPVALAYIAAGALVLLAMR
jgi:hypothetical protein